MKILIADDEKASLLRLEKIVVKLESKAEIIKASNGEKALELIEKNKPDVVFLDINMPRLTGLEVAHSIRSYKPALVFVTAYDEHAIEAFKLNALDYILKPFEEERVQEALKRAYKHPQVKFPSARFALNRISLRSDLKHKIFDYSDIVCIESVRNYSEVTHIDGVDKVIATLDELDKKLPRDRFVRCHRSFIINIDFIKEIYKNDEAKYVVALVTKEDQITLPISIKRLDDLKKIMGV